MNLIMKIKNLFNPVIQTLWVIFKEAFKIIASMAFAGLTDIVINAIIEVSADPDIIKDEDKRKVAFDKIKEQLAIKGKELGDNSINVLIEVGVAYLKRKRLL